MDIKLKTEQYNDNARFVTISRASVDGSLSTAEFGERMGNATYLLGTEGFTKFEIACRDDFDYDACIIVIGTKNA